MDWNIRKATPADADSLALIGGATFLETFAGVLDGAAIVAHCQSEHNAAAYRDYMGRGAQAWLVEASHGNAPIGFSLVGEASLPGRMEDGSDLELKRIYTLSRFHGGGIGADLMQRALDHARRQGAKRLLLGVYEGNVRARAFYIKSGFTQIAERQFRVGDREYGDVVLARNVD